MGALSAPQRRALEALVASPGKSEQFYLNRGVHKKTLTALRTRGLAEERFVPGLRFPDGARIRYHATEEGEALLKRPKGKPKTAIRCVSPTLRVIFELADAQDITLAEISRRVGAHPNQVSNWRKGVREPGIMTVEALTAAVGFRLCLEPVEATDDAREL